jgi:hypothetical protein
MELTTPDLDLIKQVEQECRTATSSDFAVVAVDGTAVGGCSFMIHVSHAAAAIASGLCETVLITHGARPDGRKRFSNEDLSSAVSALTGRARDGNSVCRGAGASGMPTGKEFGHHTQALATAGNSRTDRPDGDVRQQCGFVVWHALQSDEQNYRALLFGQLGESAFQIANLEPDGLIRRKRQARLTFLQFGAGALARFAASEADISMVQDREQPRPKIGALLP